VCLELSMLVRVVILKWFLPCGWGQFRHAPVTPCLSWVVVFVA
jgi:hypothetical protein